MAQTHLLNKAALVIICRQVIFSLLVAIAIQSPAFAWTLSTIYNFDGTNGENPETGLVMDKAGNLYGINELTGTFNIGSVFKLSPPTPGHSTWKRTTLVNFNGKNGEVPRASLLIDKSGNLIGTTLQGGRYNFGTVFMMSPPTPGRTAWTLSTIVNFDGISGAFPSSNLVTDRAGNLYGTIAAGSGNSSSRTIFKLKPPSSGHAGWLRTNLLTFDDWNGGNPYTSLVVDPSGNIYGTTYLGGLSDLGVVFKLMPPLRGQTAAWTRTILVNFNGVNGSHPFSGLLRDAEGNLYGTTPVGGAFDFGTLYKLLTPTSGQRNWVRKTLINFNNTNGSFPEAGLIADPAGNLYGTTVGGGRYNFGTVFKLSPPTSGHLAWTRTTLVHFNGANGVNPTTSVLIDPDGNIFGTTQNGGSLGRGTVFKLTK